MRVRAVKTNGVSLVDLLFGVVVALIVLLAVTHAMVTSLDMCGFGLVYTAAEQGELSIADRIATELKQSKVIAIAADHSSITYQIPSDPSNVVAQQCVINTTSGAITWGTLYATTQRIQYAFQFDTAKGDKRLAESTDRINYNPGPSDNDMTDSFDQGRLVRSYLDSTGNVVAGSAVTVATGILAVTGQYDGAIDKSGTADPLFRRVTISPSNGVATESTSGSVVEIKFYRAGVSSRKRHTLIRVFTRAYLHDPQT